MLSNERVRKYWPYLSFWLKCLPLDYPFNKNSIEPISIFKSKDTLSNSSALKRGISELTST
jgi:hypothetical protein